MPSRVEGIEIWFGVAQRCDENGAKSHLLIGKVWRRIEEMGENEKREGGKYVLCAPLYSEVWLNRTRKGN